MTAACRTPRAAAPDRKPVAQRAVAHLVVVGREHDETFHRHVGRGRAEAALAELRVRAVVHVRAPERLRHQRDRVELAVPALGLAGQQHAQRVVEVVGPGGVAAVAAQLRHPHHARVVEAGLGRHQRTRAGGMGAAGHLGHDVLGRRVGHRVDGVEPQPVHMEVAHPLLGALQIHSRTPSLCSPSTLSPSPQGVGWRSVKYGPNAISAGVPEAPRWL